MNTRERKILRTAAAILRDSASLQPLNPADIRRISTACRTLADLNRILAGALDSATDEELGGLEGAEEDIAVARRRLEREAQR